MDKKVKYPICPLNLYFEGDEDKCDTSKCNFDTDTRLCSTTCEIKSDKVSGIKVEEGKKREFSTGAKKQASTGKGTPVLFPPDAYLEISKHFEDGAAIYDARNWEKGIPLSKLIDSLERHIAEEKMGLTDERHDRALAWNAVVYLATKLRIQAGVLPAELADLCGAYVGEKVEVPHNIGIRKSAGYFYIGRNTSGYLWRDLKFHMQCCSVEPVDAEGYYLTKEAAEEHLQKYLKEGGE